MDDARTKGLQLFEEVYGPAAAEGLAAHIATQDFGVECARWANDFTFGEVWSRAGLERKLRSCVVLGMLIAQRQEDEIGYHTRMAAVNGLTRTEIEEILYTAISYCGFPAANVAKRAMKDAFARMEAGPEPFAQD